MASETWCEIASLMDGGASVVGQRIALPSFLDIPAPQ